LLTPSSGIGQGPKKDEAKAAYWYFQAAEGGFLRAQVAIGSLLWRGRGTPQNMDEALKWYAYTSPFVPLRVCHAHHKVALFDLRIHIARLTKAAESKDMEGMKACFKLGQIYEEQADCATVRARRVMQFCLLYALACAGAHTRAGGR
jgi:TPR repeat protein